MAPLIRHYHQPDAGTGARLTWGDNNWAIGSHERGYQHHYLGKSTGRAVESKEHSRGLMPFLEKIATMPSNVRPWNFPKKRGLILPSRDLNGIATRPRRGYTSENGSVLLPTSLSTVCAMGISARQPVQRATLPIQRLASDLFFKKFFIEKKQGSFTPKTARTLTQRHSGSKEAHTIDSSGPFDNGNSVSATSIRPNPLIFISRPA